MIKLFLVGVGGFVGAVSRYLAGGVVQRSAGASLFPYGTAAVNIAGCLAIGFAAGLAEYRGFFSPDTRAFLLVGLLGGFTTFSTFGYETYELVRTGQLTSALGSVLLNVVLGLAGVWLGHSLARML